MCRADAPGFKNAAVAPAGMSLLKINVLRVGGAGADFDDVGEACGATPSPVQKVRFFMFSFKLWLQTSDLFIKPNDFLKSISVVLGGPGRPGARLWAASAAASFIYRTNGKASILKPFLTMNGKGAESG